MPLFGVDVSEHQGTVDWHAVAAAGVSFAIIKALEGTTYHDPKWATNLAGAEKAGIGVVGAYHFLTATSPALTQADAFCHVAPPGILHALDVEAPGPLDVKGWVARYREHYPHHPLLIYTGKYLWSQRAKVPYDGGGFGPLWNAGCVPGGYVPGVDETLTHSYGRVGSQNAGLPFHGWDTWTLMQFSESCRVPGIPTRVDANAYRGTLDQLKALTGSQEDDMPTLDEIGKLLDAKLGQVPGDVWGFPVGAELEADGKTHTTQAIASQRNYNRLEALAGLTPDAIAAAIVAQFKTLPAGTATVDDATIAKVAQATATELATRLVR